MNRLMTVILAGMMGACLVACGENGKSETELTAAPTEVTTEAAKPAAVVEEAAPAATTTEEAAPAPTEAPATTPAE